MNWKGNILVFIFVLLSAFDCHYCSVHSNDTSTSSYDDDDHDIVPQFRSKTIEASNVTLVIKVGGTIRINCGVKGYPRPSVFFYKENTLLREPTPSDLDPSRVLIERTILKVSHANRKDSGTYRCIAQNGNFNKSLSFHVEVVEGNSHEDEEIKEKKNSDAELGKPRWTKSEKMLKTLHAEPAGNTVKFRCAVEGNPTPIMHWFKDNKIIKKDSRIGGFKYKSNGQMIVLESVVPQDEGTYMCRATNKYGSLNHTYQLDVQERHASSPFPAESIQNQTTYVGGDVIFRCKWYSDAHPHIEWVKHRHKGNTTQIVAVKSAGVNTTSKDMEMLHLKNVSFNDAGEYTCLAGNSIGISHQSAWLTVLPVPPPTTPGAIPSGTEDNLVVYIIGGVLALIVTVSFFLFLYYCCYNEKDPPMLVRIENPDKIPEMTEIEIPTIMYGNDQAWRRMCPPMQEQFDFNIIPDLQWELRREDIILTDRLDEGFFGQVFKADLYVSNSPVVCAVKMLKVSQTEKDFLDLLTEMDQMKRVGKHKNIINLLGVCTQHGPLMLVIEYASEGNLREFLRRNRPQNMHCNLVLPTDGSNPQPPESYPPQDSMLSQKDLVSFAYQVSRGMDYLAQKKCIHRDLAARNVLVTEDRIMKIADFGLARDIRSCDYYRKHTRGHLPYKWMALEAMADNVFTHATDVWSFGILLWEIFSLAGTPYPGIKTGELVKFLRSGERLEKPQFASQEMYILMRDCWDEDHRRRPIFRSLVEDLERMLAESSNDEYINSGTADFILDSCESEISEDEEEDDDVFVQTENSDSVSDGNAPFNEEQDSYNSDSFVAPLLENREENIMHNHHARLQSDV